MKRFKNDFFKNASYTGLLAAFAALFYFILQVNIEESFLTLKIARNKEKTQIAFTLKNTGKIPIDVLSLEVGVLNYKTGKFERLIDEKKLLNYIYYEETFTTPPIILPPFPSNGLTYICILKCVYKLNSFLFWWPRDVIHFVGLTNKGGGATFISRKTYKKIKHMLPPDFWPKE